MWWMIGAALAQPAPVGPLALDPEWTLAATPGGWRVSAPALDRVGATVALQVAASTAPTCEPAPLRDATLDRRTAVTVNGVVWTMVEGGLGCRNARPPAVHACAVVDGQHVQLQFVPLGCRGGPGGAGELEALLAALRPAQSAG
jgi:hypothetical protein